MEDVMKFEKVKVYVERNDVDQEILEQAEIQVKYSGYIEKRNEIMRIS
jgi:tRNA uridine 5-carboxymethylaminomethyl modification enzyme